MATAVTIDLEEDYDEGGGLEDLRREGEGRSSREEEEVGLLPEDASNMARLVRGPGEEDEDYDEDDDGGDGGVSSRRRKKAKNKVKAAVQ